jgi:hypothetical protein
MTVTLFILPFFMALANLIPLIFGIYKVDEQGDIPGVAVLSAIVWLAQIVLAVIVGAVFTGGMSFALFFAGARMFSGFMLLLLLFTGLVSYLTTFAILGFCHKKFVSKEV